MDVLGAAAEANKASGYCVVFDEFETLSRLIDHEIVAKDQTMGFLDGLPSIAPCLHHLAHLDELLHEGIPARTLIQELMNVFFRAGDNRSH